MRLRYSSALLLVAGLVIALPAAAQPALEKAPRIRMLVQSSPLAGFRHGAAADVWEDLRTGDKLILVREAGNAFDANAVRVDWRGHME